MTFLAEAKAAIAGADPKAFSYAVGHEGDGNIHLSAYVEKTETTESVAARVYERIDARVWDYGGSIVAENRVGSLYRDRVHNQKRGTGIRNAATVEELF